MTKLLKRICLLIAATTMLLSVSGCKSSEGKTDCGDDHTYEEKIVTEAKALSDGLKKFICSKCGHSYEEVIPATKSIKILALGNSYTEDAMKYLPFILTDAGIETVVLGNLVVSGCTLGSHWLTLSKERSPYTYYKSTGDSYTTTQAVSAQTAFAEEDWDFVILQQAPGDSGKANTFDQLSEIVKIVQECEPGAQIIWHQTWAYQADSTRSDFPDFNRDQMTMYNAIINTVKDKVLPEEGISGVLPVGTTIQNLRTSYLGDTLTRDGYHLSYDRGRYTAGLLWYAYLTGGSLDIIDYYPADYTYVEKDILAIREAVTNAIAKPYEITQSTHLTAIAS